MNRLSPLAFAVALLVTSLPTVSRAESLKVLFLGDQGHHRPKERFDQVESLFKKRGIDITYTERMSDLNPSTLKGYRALLLYANIATIEPDQAIALLHYVRDGGGFVPIHCATFCFRNSPDVVALMGAQFKRHGTGVFKTETSGIDHPILRGFESFSSWDETYVHHLHNEAERTVLEYRSGEPQAEGQSREPWTWVRSHGKGRVFYTAWGHDQRTWGHPGFHQLLERGIRWASGEDPSTVPLDKVALAAMQPFSADESAAKPASAPEKLPAMTELPKNLKPFDYVDVGPKIPNYAAGRGETLTRMQLPVPASQSMEHMVTPQGFAVELFADESMFRGKPITMNWDEQGRLWVGETVDYPHDLDEQNQGRDVIRVLIDRDQNGKADDSVVFADKLSIPTAIAFHRGGLVVQNGSETLFLKDTDGDLKADVRQLLISNWGMGDTHGGVSNFRNGLDNWIWGMQGYNNSSPKIGDETLQSFRMGFFRFKLSQTDPPKVERLEFVRSTTNNTWGLGITEEGLIFGSTANRQPSFFMPIANRYYERVLGWAPETLQMISDTHLFHALSDKVRQVDHHGGYTAAAGHAIYTARNYPKFWWNRTAFVCEPTGKLVGTFMLKPNGAGFSSTNPINLLASNDEWTAPIMAEVGPDGNVWVIDWYNYIVQHNPTPQGFETGRGAAYQTDLRDKKYGRIYRVVYRGQEPSAAGASILNLANETPVEKLVEALEHPTMLIRLNAQRLLVERGNRDCIPLLLKKLESNKTDEIGLNVAAIHALPILAELGAFQSPDSPSFRRLIQSLSHPSAAVRLNAIRVLPPVDASFAGLVSARPLTDAEPQVVLAALLALSDMPNVDAGATLATAVTDTKIINDRWLSDALISASATHASSFLHHYLAQAKASPPGPPTLAILRRIAEHHARTKPDGKAIGRLLGHLRDDQPSVIATIVDGWKAGWDDQHAIELDPQGNRDLLEVFRAAGNQSAGTLAQMAKSWGSDALAGESTRIAQALLAEFRAPDKDVDDRLAAAKRLIEFDPSRIDTAEAVLEEVTPLAAPDLATGLVRLLAINTHQELGKRLVQVAQGATPTIRETVIQTMLTRPTLTMNLIEALQSGALSLTDLSTLERQSLSEHPQEPIRRAARDMIRKAGGAISPDRDRVLNAKLPLAAKTGDPQAGKLIFTKNCSNCHVFQGDGKNVGPNLTGMSVHPKAELLTHILDPSRSVEANYRLYTVLTKDALVVNGVLAAESKTSIELVDAQGVKHTILREDIDSLKGSTKSAMPEGLETSIDDQGFVDLLEYLTQRGTHLPIALDKVANTITTQGMFQARDNQRERLVFADWGIKTVEGVPFQLVDPRGATTPNAVMLYSPSGKFAPGMPKSVMLSCRTSAKAIHLLSGVSGWGAKEPSDRGVAMIVRLHYRDGQREDHPLIDGQHFADYIGRFDVPLSKHAFDLKGAQLRYLSIAPKRTEIIESIELVKPEHRSAPLVMAITVEIPKH